MHKSDAIESHLRIDHRANRAASPNQQRRTARIAHFVFDVPIIDGHVVLPCARPTLQLHVDRDIHGFDAALVTPSQLIAVAPSINTFDIACLSRAVHRHGRSAVIEAQTRAVRIGPITNADDVLRATFSPLLPQVNVDPQIDIAAAALRMLANRTICMIAAPDKSALLAKIASATTASALADLIGSSLPDTEFHNDRLRLLIETDVAARIQIAAGALGTMLLQIRQAKGAEQ